MDNFMQDQNRQRDLLSPLLQSQKITVTLFVASLVSTSAMSAQTLNKKPWQTHFMPPDLCRFSIESKFKSSNFEEPLVFSNKVTVFSTGNTSINGKPDPTLHFISADEPFVLPGAPPLPRSIDCDLPTSRHYDKGGSSRHLHQADSI